MNKLFQYVLNDYKSNLSYSNSLTGLTKRRVNFRKNLFAFAFISSYFILVPLSNYLKGLGERRNKIKNLKNEKRWFM